MPRTRPPEPVAPPRLPGARSRALGLAIGALLAASCADPPIDELAITCEGKCDGLDSVRALVADARTLGLSDLLAIGGDFATVAFDDGLGGARYASIQRHPTELYAPAAIARGADGVHDLDALVTGLAARFGDTSLSTEVNRLRAEHLARTGQRVYAESAFAVLGGLDHGWRLPTRGFGASAEVPVTLGFDAGAELELRVVSVHPHESPALVDAPLAAIKAARGFVLPRALADVGRMAPGESFALAGRGRLGVNLGVGVPILLANPLGLIAYDLVLSAGLRSVFEGQVDVQLVKLAGDAVVVDVGVRDATLAQASIALADGWGVHGLLERSVTLGGARIDLDALLDVALIGKVSDKLSLLAARAERTRTAMRMSVARLRFDLAVPDPLGGRGAALAQALHGDVRLAQALAARGDAGVVAEFDLMRSGVSAVAHVGIDLLGMRWFRHQAESEGAAVVQTPGGVLALMWDSLHRASGWLYSSSAYTRVAIGGLRFDARAPAAATGETHLVVQTEEGERYMTRDQLIDQLDSVLVAAGGVGALRAVEASGNRLEQLVDARCPLPGFGRTFYEACNVALLDAPEVATLRADALAALDRATAERAAPLRALLRDVAARRLALQAIQEPDVTLVGPQASIVVDYRLDDGALRAVFEADRTAAREQVLHVLEATQLDRLADAPAQRAAIRAAAGPLAEQMAGIHAEHAARYARLRAIDGARIEGLGAIGANAIEVRFPVDAAGRPIYARAVSQSIAQARAGVAASLFDRLRDVAATLPRLGGAPPPHAEQLVAATLLGLADPDRIELRIALTTDTSSCGSCGRRYDLAGVRSLDAYARGPAAAPLAAGLFDVDALIDAPP